MLPAEAKVNIGPTPIAKSIVQGNYQAPLSTGFKQADGWIYFVAFESSPRLDYTILYYGRYRVLGKKSPSLPPSFIIVCIHIMYVSQTLYHN